MDTSSPRNFQRLEDTTQGLAAKIIAGVNKDEFKNKLQETCSIVIDPTLVAKLTTELAKLKNHDADMIKWLIEAERTATSTNPAWRPTTGIVDMRPYKIDALLMKKMLLLKHIKAETAEVVELEASVKHLKTENKLLMARMAAI